MSIDDASMQQHEQLEQHITEVREEPSTLLNTTLLESLGPIVSQQPREANIPLVSNILRTLPVLQQDPAPLSRLLLQILEAWNFWDVLSLTPSPDLAQGLDLASAPFNGLTLSILEKAATTPADAARVAASPKVVYQLVKL